MLRLAFAANDPRASFLGAELDKLVHVAARIDFDDIDLFTKCVAALLSFAVPRSEWWGNYQMHPLVQRRRRAVLQGELEPLESRIDALLLWGSWFHPFRNGRARHVPYFSYVDQSRSLTPIIVEPARSVAGHRRVFEQH